MIFEKRRLFLYRQKFIFKQKAAIKIGMCYTLETLRIIPLGICYKHCTKTNAITGLGNSISHSHELSEFGSANRHHFNQAKETQN